MDCSEVKGFLSAYFDDELSSDTRAAVEQHVARCDHCSRDLQAFQCLSVMAKRLPHPAAPSDAWQQLEQYLENVPNGRLQLRGVVGAARWFHRPYAVIGLVAAAVILIAVGWYGYSALVGIGKHHELAAVFGEFLEEFRHEPRAAQQILLAHYEGRAMDAEQAVHAVGYRPAVADGMPAGYTVETTYVMKMPCCTCVQCLCKRSDETTIAVFEHDEEEPDWFGNRPETQALCNGTRCSLVELGDRIAASWKRGERHITVVGVRDTAEIGELVAWFDNRRRVEMQ